MTNRVLVSLAVLLAAACASEKVPAPPPPAPPMDPVQARIDEALSAAPAPLASAAAVMDWPGADGKMAELRPGTNGWVCMPSPPVQGADSAAAPMCLDKAWQGWAQGYTTKGPIPAFEGIGTGYMLSGDRGVSNIDPYATAATPDNQWVEGVPHIMLIVPDPKQLEGMPTDPKNGGPYVMWKGTPYVHLMIPLK